MIPRMTREITRDVLPGLDEAIIYYLAAVIVNELIAERAYVCGKRHRHYDSDY
jgi:hypothetical protein